MAERSKPKLHFFCTLDTMANESEAMSWANWAPPHGTTWQSA